MYSSTFLRLFVVKLTMWLILVNRILVELASAVRVALETQHGRATSRRQHHVEALKEGSGSFLVFPFENVKCLVSVCPQL